MAFNSFLIKLTPSNDLSSLDRRLCRRYFAAQPRRSSSAGELAQLAATKPIGQLPCRLAASHRGIPAKDVMQVKQVVEALVGVPDVIARQDLLGYAEGVKTTSKLLVSAHKLIHLLRYVTPTQ